VSIFRELAEKGFDKFNDYLVANYFVDDRIKLW
jgi:hypothetical protein